MLAKWCQHQINTLSLSAAKLFKVWISEVIRYAFSALTLLVGQQEGHLACKKTKQWWGAGMVVCLEQGAHLPSWWHCHSPSLASVKSRLVLPFVHDDALRHCYCHLLQLGQWLEALEALCDYALYKSTFYLLTYLLETYEWYQLQSQVPSNYLFAQYNKCICTCIVAKCYLQAWMLGRFIFHGDKVSNFSLRPNSET